MVLVDRLERRFNCAHASRLHSAVLVAGMMAATIACDGDAPAPAAASSDESGGDESDTGEEPDPTDLTAQIDALVAAQCELAASCGCQNAAVATDCDTNKAAQWQARIDAGTGGSLTLDTACLATTLQQVQAQQCRWPKTDNGHVCESYCAVYYGEQPEGASCIAFDAVVSDCAQGLTCHGGTCVQPCAALSGLTGGQTCQLEEFGPIVEQCADGHYCTDATGACAVAPAVGEPCPDRECADGAWCDWETDRCIAVPTLGEPCPDGRCDDTSYCEWEAGETCLAYAAIGESCDGRRCAEGLFCDETRRCNGPAAIGESCDSRPCVEGSVCDWEIQQCLALPTAGQACPQNTCDGALWCDRTDPDRPEGYCAEAIAFGEACRGHSQCQTGYCPAGFCLALPKLGESCVGTNACARGLRCDGELCVETLTQGPAVCIYPGW